MCYARGKAACLHVGDRFRQLKLSAFAEAQRLGDHVADVCGGLKISSEFHSVERGDAEAAALRYAAHSDLLVVGAPEQQDLSDYFHAGKVLLSSGVPILVVPGTWEGRAIGNKIVISWNSTRESQRAMADAMAFLVEAQRVTLLVVDPVSKNSKSEAPASELVHHLDRHGVRTTVDRVTARGFADTAVILGYAEHSEADLLVMGGSRKSRLARLFLRRTTRLLLTETPLPTLIAT
jgi:nucleotide-binding universal stress UspA family protein